MFDFDRDGQYELAVGAPSYKAVDLLYEVGLSLSSYACIIFLFCMFHPFVVSAFFKLCR